MDEKDIDFALTAPIIFYGELDSKSNPQRNGYAQYSEKGKRKNKVLSSHVKCKNLFVFPISNEMKSKYIFFFLLFIQSMDIIFQNIFLYTLFLFDL